MPRLSVFAALVFIVVRPHVTNADLAITTAAAFTSPIVLDFETAPVGSVSGTSSLFTDFGITSVTPGPSTADFVQSYDDFAGASNALFVNAGGLVIEEPGGAVADLAQDDVEFRIKFANDQSRVGFSFIYPHIDPNASNPDLFVYKDDTLVGSLVFTGPIAGPMNPAVSYFTSDIPFDEIRLLNDDNTNSVMGLDNITLEATAVPEPSAFFLGLVAVAVLGVKRFKRRSK